MEKINLSATTINLYVNIIDNLDDPTYIPFTEEDFALLRAARRTRKAKNGKGKKGKK